MMKDIADGRKPAEPSYNLILKNPRRNAQVKKNFQLGQSG